MSAFTWKNVLSTILCISAIGASGPPASSRQLDSSHQPDSSNAPDKVARCFNGYDGVFVMRDTDGKSICNYNDQQASKATSPCSTFKIVIALVGLETGVIKDENTTEKWDGSKQEVEDWGKDHNLKTAMEESVNWYFQRACSKIGQKNLEKYLKLLNYGNEDMSSGLDNFWMGEIGSLRITPAQEVDFLERLYAEKLPLSKRSQQIVKNILKVDESPNAVLYGKTGTDSRDGKITGGWFVGFVESKKGNYVFATRVAGDGVLGRKAREITKNVLAELGDW